MLNRPFITPDNVPVQMARATDGLKQILLAMNEKYRDNAIKTKPSNTLAMCVSMPIESLEKTKAHARAGIAIGIMTFSRMNL